MTRTTADAVPTARQAPFAGVRATARITAATGGGITTLPVLDGDGPFELRRLRSRGTEARVCVVGAMSAPLGGDRLRIEATVRPHAVLHVTSAAATLALRGPVPGPASYDVHLTVAKEAGLHWLPKPLICAAGSSLRQTWTVDLAPTARLVLREEQVLGRAGEPPGRVATRLTVRRGGRVLLDQEAAYGPGVPGWDGPAVLGGHRTAGQLLVVDPAFADDPPGARLLGDPPGDGQALLTPLAGPAVLVTAVAPDGPCLRRLLDGLWSTLGRGGRPGPVPQTDGGGSSPKTQGARTTSQPSGSEKRTAPRSGQ
ncbi:urease accessory protein UreD [Streptomyces sp. TRM 70351]|uniref:urease accessory protein UreD n=1 Tax=Streptomyces sp. TRM 70351 TaxID=3116552 RepID=UPI002E7B015B|nr:urease accessory protein UreD [Streptomyces sp. TRM 70351]MEE1928469.1 urease accessory protein UreD [Streptomyces sp. TRM 70351]